MYIQWISISYLLTYYIPTAYLPAYLTNMYVCMPKRGDGRKKYWMTRLMTILVSTTAR